MSDQGRRAKRRKRSLPMSHASERKQAASVCRILAFSALGGRPIDRMQV
jgi:hypothetical protein